MQGLVTVFGGTGFVGRQVVRALAKKGLRIRVASRRPGRGYRLRMLGDVGQIEVVQANIRDEASVARALEGAQTVINLVGILYQSGAQRFAAVQTDGAATVARLAKAAGVSRFVQISAIGADPASPSGYGRSKAEGEAAVRAVYPDAIVIRPSVVFGPEDDFFNRFAFLASVSPALPLIGGGQAKVAPVYVGDLAAAIAAAAEGGHDGQTFEIGGAEMTWKEVMAFVCAETGRKRLLLPIPFFAAEGIGLIGDIASLLIKPPLTVDQVQMLRADNVPAAGTPGLDAFGIKPKAIEAVVPGYLYRFRKGGQYAAAPEGAV